MNEKPLDGERVLFWVVVVAVVSVLVMMVCLPATGQQDDGRIDVEGILDPTAIASTLQSTESLTSKLKSQSIVKSIDKSQCYTPELARRPPRTASLVGFTGQAVVRIDTSRPSPWDVMGLGDNALLNKQVPGVLQSFTRWTGGLWGVPPCEQHPPYGCWSLQGEQHSTTFWWRPALEAYAKYAPAELSHNPLCAGAKITVFEEWFAKVGADYGLVCRALEFAPDGARRPACYDPVACQSAVGCQANRKQPKGTVTLLNTILGCAMPVCGLGTVAPPPPPPIGPVCGERGCERELGETCASCERDCGPCAPPPPPPIVNPPAATIRCDRWRTGVASTSKGVNLYIETLADGTKVAECEMRQ